MLLKCGVLKVYLQSCGENYWGEDNCEPDRVIVLYLTALARILLVSPNLLQTLLPLALPSGRMFREEELVRLHVIKMNVLKAWTLFCSLSNRIIGHDLSRFRCI